MIHSLSINWLGINQHCMIHNPRLLDYIQEYYKQNIHKYIKNSYVHCDLHNFSFCDQPGATSEMENPV
jgi:hypothetical protein